MSIFCICTSRLSKVLCNLHGCLNVSWCVYPVFGLVRFLAVFTVDVAFFTHDHLATLLLSYIADMRSSISARTVNTGFPSDCDATKE